MQLKVFKDDVLEGLGKAANIIPAKTGAAYLRTIWLKAEDGLSIMSTDSNLEFSGTYRTEVVEPGLTGVQGRAFYDLIRKLPPGEITLKLDEDSRNLLIQQGRRKYKLPTNDVTWFQNFSLFPEGEGLVWSGDFIQELIDRIAFCVGEEDRMEAIACLCLKPGEGEGVVESCGLNGHQFAMLSFLNDDLKAMLPEEGILIQKKYLMELRKWIPAGDVELAISNKRLFFKGNEGSETFSLPLAGYAYPDYHNFLAKLEGDDVSLLTFQRDEMGDALERLLIFNTETNRGSNFEFSGQEATLDVQGQETGSATESLEVAFEGSLAKIVFPTRNLLDIMGHFSSKKLKFTMTGAEGPCGISGEDDPEYQIILMPMKAQEETYYSEEDE